MRFEDVSPAILTLERIVDDSPLGPPPAPAGCYGCSARMAEESRFAESELVGDGDVTVFDRPHPLSRRHRPARRTAATAVPA
jgi:hypothetical protein